MDIFFENLFRLSENEIIENYSKKYQNQLNEILSYSSQNDQMKLRDALKSLEIIAIRTGDILNNFRGNLKSQQKLEDLFYSLIEELTPLISQKTFTIDNLHQINQILYRISSQPKSSIFKVDLYSSIILKIRKERILSFYDDDSFKFLIDTMRIDLKLSQIKFTDSPSNIKNTTEYIDRIGSKFQYCIEDFFDYLSKDDFIKYINHIQKYYEFCLTICDSTIINCPYKQIPSKIIRVANRNKPGKLDSIYFNFSNAGSEAQEELSKIIHLYQEILTNEAYVNFDENVLIEFGTQIQIVTTYQDEKTNFESIFRKLKLVSEILFDIFIEAKNAKSLRVLAKFNLNIKDIFSKNRSKTSSNLNAFNNWIISKTTECTNHVYLNWNYFDKSDQETFKNVDLYSEFIQKYISYIENQVKEKSNSKECFNLIISLVNLSTKKPTESCLRLINALLNKENFYAFKEHSKETIEVLSSLLNLIFKIGNKVFPLDMQEKNNYLNYINTGLIYLKIRMMKFKENIKSIQSLLFEKIIFEVIEMSNSLCDNSFTPVIVFMDYLSFEFFPKDKQSLEKLEKLYEKAISSEYLDLIQSDETTKHRSEYFLEFFKNIFESFLTRKDILDITTNQNISLLSSLEDKNDFLNDNENEGITINYKIFNELSKNLFLTQSVNEELIDKSINIWMQIFDSDNNILMNNFCESILNASKNYVSLTAKIVEKLWRIYFETKNIRISQPIVEILELTKDYFIQEIAEPYASLLILDENEYENRIIFNTPLIFKIAQKAPEFYFLNLVDKNLNIIELFENNKNKKPDDFNIIMGAILVTIQNLTGKKFDENFYENAFEQRRLFFRLLFIEGEQKPISGNNKRQLFVIENYSAQLVVKFICDFYFYLIKNINDRKKVRDLLSDLIEIFDELRDTSTNSIFVTMHEIGKYNEKAYFDLIKEHREYFVSIQNDKSCIEIETQVNALIDFIDGKSFETFTEQIKENTINITNLQKVTKKQELNILNMKQNMNDINLKMEDVQEQIDKQEVKIEEIDSKTLHNLPIWCNEIKKILLVEQMDWIIVAKRLNFSENDIKGWLAQHDPFMSMLQEWFLINKTSDAILGLLNAFKELNYTKCVNIIEDNLKDLEAGNIKNMNESDIDKELLSKPPQVFICYEWSSKSKAQLLKDHLDKSLDLHVWFDDGNMGGGSMRNKRIDVGLRSCHVLICLITKEITEDKTCVNQIHLAIQLNKSIIPLLIDKNIKWPPQGSLGPILSEYLFIRFFQRLPKEATNDERYWPSDKFDELIMQLRQLVPSFSKIKLQSTSLALEQKLNESTSAILPEVFISYQWDKQKDIIKLYEKLTNMGVYVWLDIHQMGGGDSLYDKIDNGIRNSSLIISCVTFKYGLSANCRKEVALADSLSKPIIPILIEKNFIYPPAGPMAPILASLKYIDFTDNFDENNSLLWQGEPFVQLLEKMKAFLSKSTIEKVTSKACCIS